jgi:acetoin utilization deacetylase AcuC-like enzyme
MRVTTEGYAWVVRQLVNIAPEGSIAFVTEGGYDLTALRDCLDAAIAEASRGATDIDAATPSVDAGLSTARGERALDTIRAAQKGFWRL